MESRIKKLSSQLGHKIPDAGAHIPHVVVGLIRKRRSKKKDAKEQLVGGSKVKPTKEYNPHPFEFVPGSM